jgi:voltage-gated potassium channel
VALLISTFFPISKELNELLDIIGDCICIFFLYDFFKRLYQAKDKWQFMKWGWIDLLSSIPALEVLRAGRLFRLLRLLRILSAFRSSKILVEYVFKSKIKGTMMSVFIITILLMIFSSISILMVETVPSGNIKIAGDALWWTIETITMLDMAICILLHLRGELSVRF